MEAEVYNKMMEEYKELDTRVNNCRKFISDKEKFEALDNLNRDLLIAQLKAMETYLSLIAIRLGLNGDSTKQISEITEISE
jgi:hypothetical protein